MCYDGSSSNKQTHLVTHHAAFASTIRSTHASRCFVLTTNAASCTARDAINPCNTLVWASISAARRDPASCTSSRLCSASKTLARRFPSVVSSLDCSDSISRCCVSRETRTDSELAMVRAVPSTVACSCRCSCVIDRVSCTAVSTDHPPVPRTTPAAAPTAHAITVVIDRDDDTDDDDTAMSWWW